MKDIMQKKVNQFINMKRLREKAIKHSQTKKINMNDKRFLSIYHTIETKKMNGADMYAMMKALQNNLRQQEHHFNNEPFLKDFEAQGGIQRYNELKIILEHNGVDTNELH